jgi:hypothetical protein
LREFLNKQPDTDQNKHLKQDVTVIDLFSGWILPEEFAAFTNKLALQNRDAYEVFMKSNEQTEK